MDSDIKNSNSDDVLYAVSPPPSRRPWALALAAPAILVVPWCLGCRAFGISGPLGTAAGMLLCLLLAAATVTDLKWCRIFNWTTYTAAFWAIAFSIVGVLAPESVNELLGFPNPGEVLAGLAACLVLMVLLFSIVRGGAGDVKLVAAIGAILGWERGLHVWICACIAAAAFATILIIWRVGPLHLSRRLMYVVCVPGVRLVDGEFSTLLQRRMPMAPFIAVGALLTASQLV
jgi:prepilin peptidase CpaA